MKRKCLRSREGCVTCKRRRKKCDEARPICSNCKRLKLGCQYLKKVYWNETNQSTKSHYLMKVTPSKHMIVTSQEDVILSLQLSWGEKSLSRIKDDLHRTDSSKDLNLQNMNFTRDPKVELELFDYYVHVVSRKRAFSDNQLNEFRSIIIPHCETSPLLFQSIIALSASDLIRNFPSDNPYLHYLSKEYKNKAIDLMYNLLDLFGKDSINEIVISLLVLCSLEIGSSLHNNWIIYLKQSCLIFLSIDDETILSTPALLFAYRYVSLRYILLLTTLDIEEYQNMEQNYPLKIIDCFFDNKEIDYMFGCPPLLLKFINRITHIKNTRIVEAPPQTVLDLYDAINELKEQKSSEEQLSYCSNLYLYSCKLYFMENFDYELSRLHIGFNKEKLVDDTIREFSKMLECENPALFPTWALIMLSASGVGDDVRIRVLDICDKIEDFWPRSSASVVRVAINLLWKVTDLNDKLDWRRIFSYKNINLPIT